MSKVFLLLYQYVYKINYILSKVFTRIGGIAIIVMSLIIFAQVIKRYIFNAPFEWAEEATIYLMVYVTFLCLPYITLLNKNIAMTLIYDRFKEKRTGYIFDALITGTFLFILIMWIPLAINLFIASNRVPALQMPIKRSVLHFVIPVSFIFTLFICIQKTIKAIIGVIGPSQIEALNLIEQVTEGESSDDSDVIRHDATMEEIE